MSTKPLCRNGTSCIKIGCPFNHQQNGNPQSWNNQPRQTNSQPSDQQWSQGQQWPQQGQQQSQQWSQPQGQQWPQQGPPQAQGQQWSQQGQTWPQQSQKGHQISNEARLQKDLNKAIKKIDRLQSIGTNNANESEIVETKKCLHYEERGCNKPACEYLHVSKNFKISSIAIEYSDAECKNFCGGCCLNADDCAYVHKGREVLQAIRRVFHAKILLKQQKQQQEQQQSKANIK